MAVLTLALACVLYFSGITSTFSAHTDSAHYILLAKSIVNGLGYTYTAGPVDTPENMYPFVFPLFLAPLIYFFPKGYLALKFVSIFFALAYIPLLFFCIRKFYKDELSILVPALVVFTPQFFYYSHQILTEIPFIFFSTMSLYFLTRYKEESTPINRYLFFSVIGLFLSFYTRGTGLIIFISSLLFFLLRRDYKKTVALSILFLIVITPWTLRTISLGKSGHMIEFFLVTHSFSGLLYRSGYHLLVTIGNELPSLFFYPFSPYITPRTSFFVYNFLIKGILSALLAYGFLLKIRKTGMELVDLYTLVYFFLYLFWTHHGARYLLPLLPFLTYYLLYAVSSISRRSLSVAFAALLMVYVSGDITEAVREHKQPLTREQVSFLTAADWIRESLPENSLILSRNPRVLHVHTKGEYRGVMLLRTKDAQKQYAYLMKNKIEYIVIDQVKMYLDDARDYLFPLVEDYKDNFELIYKSQNEPVTYIYRVKR